MPDHRLTRKFLLPIKGAVTLPPAGADPSACLEPTDVIDSTHPAIEQQASQLTTAHEIPFTRASALFYFVRDEIRYSFTPDLQRRQDWRASKTLRRGDGFCQQKTVLLAALARAAGIPSAIGFQHIRDYKLLDTRYEEPLPDGIIPFHGLTFFWLDGAWWIADATLDAGLCERRGYRLVELERGAHARLPATDLDGNPHFDFLEEFGPFPNLPMVITDHELELRPAWLELKRIAERTGATM